MNVGAGLYMYDVVIKKFTFAISSPDEFLYKRFVYPHRILMPDSRRQRDESVEFVVSLSRNDSWQFFHTRMRDSCHQRTIIWHFGSGRSVTIGLSRELA